MDELRRAEVRRGEVVLSGLHGGGPGPVVVLLHGLAGSAEELRPTAMSLAADHRLIVPDQRGHGHSTRRPDDLSRNAYVEDVLAIVDAWGDGNPVTLVGQSMGAHTALLVAAEHADRVQRLVLLEGGVGGDGADGYPATLGEWFASWPTPFPDRAAAVAYLGGTASARSWARDLEERPDGWWPRFDADVMERAVTAVADHARWAEWQQIRVPTLLVRGERSAIDDAEVQQMTALRPDVDLVVVPDAGHDAHLEQPEAWAAVLRSFVDT
jgi:pimeloyl-ACP methyl ester carboxylesterase